MILGLYFRKRPQLSGGFRKLFLKIYNHHKPLISCKGAQVLILLYMPEDVLAADDFSNDGPAQKTEMTLNWLIKRTILRFDVDGNHWRTTKWAEPIWETELFISE